MDLPNNDDVDENNNDEKSNDDNNSWSQKQNIRYSDNANKYKQ